MQKSEQIIQISNGPGKYAVNVVGESHYQDELETICGGRTDESQYLEVAALLELEDDNKYDSNAVAVTINGLKVGYLDRETAKSFRKQFAEVAPGIKMAACNAIIVGGWDRGEDDRGHFGVKLDIPVA